MALSAMTVSQLMTGPVVSVTPDTTLDKAYQLMAVRRISSVPVVEEDGRPVGVLSETDLLHIGRLQPASLAGVQILDLPAEPVGMHMHAGIITVATETTVAAAAQILVDNHIHRVFVRDDDDPLVGVFSTEEVLAAIREHRIPTPIGDVMTTPVETIGMHAHLVEATSRLDRAHRSVLAVVDDQDHPIGVFTKTEALRARNAAPDAPIESVMSYAMLLQNSRTPLFRAAAHAYETVTRRVLVMHDRKLAGLLTGLDFARLLAAAAR